MSYAYLPLRDNNVTVSTWKVWGNRSTGVMLTGSKTPCSLKRARSRASVAGSQLTYPWRVHHNGIGVGIGELAPGVTAYGVNVAQASAFQVTP